MVFFNDYKMSPNQDGRQVIKEEEHVFTKPREWMKELLKRD